MGSLTPPYALGSFYSSTPTHIQPYCHFLLLCLEAPSPMLVKVPVMGFGAGEGQAEQLLPPHDCRAPQAS